MNSPLLKISVATTAEAEEVVSLALEKVFARPASAYTNERTTVPVVSVYCAELSAWTPAKRRELLAELRRIKAAGLKLGSGKISVKRLPRENWAESWKKHFKPFEVGDALLVKPSWSKRRARRGQQIIVLDPGLSFGTGHHATTGFCLRELARHSKLKTQNSKLFFLDIGTGSGILAIAAVKMGYAPVHAFDFDPESVRVAAANAKRNRVLNKLHLQQRDLTKLPARSARKYDFICANLISTLLIAERKRIVNRLKPGGTLVLAGVLKKEFALVRRAYERIGLHAVTSRCEKEWRSGSFVLPE